MEHGHTEEMLKHIKIYIFVFVALAVLTLVTVWASHLQVSGTLHIVIAMAIATLKG
ncbi:cytochrome C oxidase subunit IV, partial [bacterium]